MSFFQRLLVLQMHEIHLAPLMEYGLAWGMILSKVCCEPPILLSVILQFYMTLTLPLQLQDFREIQCTDGLAQSRITNEQHQRACQL